MLRLYISTDLRRLVIKRTDSLCEYCLFSDTDGIDFQLDHIISVKHGGATTAENLAYSCIFCNLQKGTDLGSINWQTGELVRFFNPRRDFWGDHFRLEDAIIRPLTDIGEVTVRIFDFNNDERVVERQVLMTVDRYPSASALQRMSQ
ncbi:HNH endonuclease [Scytonema sp. UIC 10036]|uniref:HNH endonuclease n=1 Tax=Scytonema sp. UIC 10036 TaxID=2304196 RepID=UPI00137E3AEF|nr:HNH endonuclease [Scytonema sp. UIC 10036]